MMIKLACWLFKTSGYRLVYSWHGDRDSFNFEKPAIAPIKVKLSWRDRLLLYKMEARRKNKIVQEQIDRVRIAELLRVKEHSEEITKFWDEREKELMERHKAAIETQQKLNDMRAADIKGNLYEIHGIQPQNGAKPS
jgi:hypothetical protein